MIAPEMADFVAPAFEELCCRALWTLYDETPFVDVGQWWYQDHEIDVVGLTDGDTLVVGECKYRSSRTGHDALRSLESHAEEVRWTPPNGEQRHVEYALFSRAGFTESLRTTGENRDDLRLFELGDVVAALQR